MSKLSSPCRCRLGGGALALTLALFTGCDDDDDPFTPADAAVTSDARPAVDGPGGSTDGGTPSADATPDAGATPTPAADTDIALVRFNANGSVDTTFGTNGVAKIDFGPAAGSVRDNMWGLAADKQNRLVIFGTGKGEGTRNDQDRIIARVTTAGALDTSFGTNGLYRLDIAGLADNVRHGLVQDDGKIVSSGYTSQPTGVGTQAANKIVLVRLNDDGKPDMTFGVKGIVNSNPFVPAMNPDKTEWGMAEAYGVALAGGKYVTAGYGRAAPSGTVDMVSFRYGTDGAFDESWGTKGLVVYDRIGDNDRGRHLTALPDGRVLVVGSVIPVAGNINALALVLNANGGRDAAFGTDGVKDWDFGRPDEAFYGVSVSPNNQWAVAAGYRAGAALGVMEDDDATIAFLPLAGGAETAKAVPVSDTANDRFWTVAFGADNKAYAGGYVSEGGDNAVIVARFDSTGTLDTTFGTNGIAKLNVVVGGADEARALVVLSDGKIVVAGAAEKK